MYVSLPKLSNNMDPVVGSHRFKNLPGTSHVEFFIFLFIFFLRPKL